MRMRMRKIVGWLVVGISMVTVGMLVSASGPSGSKNTTIATALANGKAVEDFRAEAGEYGLLCRNKSACREVIQRAQKNPELKKALLQMRDSGVGVFADSWLWYNAGSIAPFGWVEINTWASDQRIIAFLAN